MVATITSFHVIKRVILAPKYTFFASVFVNEPTGELPIFGICYHGTPVTELKTDLQDLTKRLKYLNASKSMGPDGCHPRVLKETADILNVPLQTGSTEMRNRLDFAKSK